MTTTDTAVPEPTPEQAALVARVRRMMLIAGLTTALAFCAVLIAVGYRLFKSGERPSEGTLDVTATLPKGARIVATGVAGDRLIVTLDVGGATEIRTFDATTLKPTGRLKFATEP
jgi:H+/gluconate symporter-like permease